MGIMVYSLLWVMQDFVHQPYDYYEYDYGDDYGVFSCGSIVRALEEGHCWGPTIMRPVSGVYNGFVKLSDEPTLPFIFLPGFW